MITVGMIAVALGLWVGALLIWAGWTDRRRPTTPRRFKKRAHLKLTKNQRLLIISGFVVGVAVWLMTGWLIAVVVAPVAVWLGPMLLGDDGAAERIERFDAMAEWTRLLASSTSVTGIEQAIISTQGSIPAPINDEVNGLIARVRTNTISTHQAVRAFADDLADGGVGDLICATLLVAVDKRGTGLRSMLESLADSVDHDVRNRRATEVERRGYRTQTRLVTVIIVVFISYLFVGTDYMNAYQDGVMQFVLLGILAGFAGVLYWMRWLTLERPIPRFLGAHANATRRAERDITGQGVSS